MMERRRPSLGWYYLTACTISWIIWSPLWLPAFGVDRLPRVPFHHALGAFGPVAAAFLLSAIESGSDGPRDLLRRMVLWRGRLRWIVFSVLGPFAILAIAVIAASVISAREVSFSGFGISREFPRMSAIGFLVYNVVSFGYGEEVGWRGYALPRLQARHSAIVATLLLTIGWAIWHVPLFLYRPGYASMSIGAIAGWLFSLLTGAVLLTWLYNESRGSLLVVALFHATIDVVFTSVISTGVVVNAAGAMVTIGGLVVLIFAGSRSLSRKGKVTA